MPPSPIPAPLPPWTRWALRLAPFIENFLLGLLENEGPYEAIVGDTPPDEWRRVVLTFADVASSDPADDCVIMLDLVNITGGAIDNTWTDNDYQLCEQILTAGIVGNGSALPARLASTGIKWYRMAFNPYPVDPVPIGADKPFMDSGPPVRATAWSVPGTGITAPPQLAVVISERTPWPHHHGRVYWPVPGGTWIDTSGHVTVANVDGLANAFHATYQDLMEAEFFPSIPVTRVDKQPARALLGVTEIWVDNVFDTQRRRAYESSSYVKKLPL